MFATQYSLFDQLPDSSAPPTSDASFRTLERTALVHDAWLDLAPGWLTGDATLFDDLRESVDWRQPEVEMYERRVLTPRLVASLEPHDHPVLHSVVEVLSGRYGCRLDRISANWYRDGDDSVAWHGDRVARELPEATVATVSLRGPREFRYRPSEGGPSNRLLLGGGDLVVMGGSFQRTWRHSVPKTSGPVPPRMVVMFRHAYE